MRISDWSSDVCSSDLLGPQGIHVAHTVIDGAIDTDFIKHRHPDFDRAKAEALILNPDAIAANYVMLHKQPKSAWRSEEHTSELQSLMRISYAVFCLKKKNTQRKN